MKGILEKLSKKQEWGVKWEDSGLDDPLLECLLVITQLENRPYSAETLRAGLPLEDNKLTPELFVRAAARAGLSARVVNRPFKKINKLVLPAVLLLKDRRACVLLEVDKKGRNALVLMPESGHGETWLDVKDLEEQYLDYAIFVRPEMQVDNRASEVTQARRGHWFWGPLSQAWRIYRDVLIVSFLINLFVLATPFYIRNVFDRVLPNNAIETLWVLTIGIGIVLIFEFIFKGIRAYFIDMAGKRADVILSATLFEKALNLRAEHRPKSVGAFAKQIGEFEHIRDFITSATITTIVDLPFMFLFLAAIWFIGGPLVYIPLIAIPISLIYSIGTHFALKKSVKNTFQASTMKNATLVETMTGIEEVKTHGAESQVQRAWEDAVSNISRHRVQSRLLSGSATNFSALISQVVSIGVVVYSVYLVNTGEMSMGGLIAAMILARRVMAPLAQLASLTIRWQYARSAYQTLRNIMAMPEERTPEKSYVSRGRLNGAVEFDNVNFGYQDDQEPVLRNVSFSIQAGERVAIIGRTGSGKTTVLKVLLGLYAPLEGAVRVDGIDVQQIDPAELRHSMGYVPQDITLFHGTVRKNIQMGVPYVSDERFVEVAKTAGVDQFVSRHSKGFDMPVGERGVGLSGGQKQGIALARALVTDPPILMMDEPTSSMDSRTENQLRQRLGQIIKDKTLILVTHRASLLDLVDRIIMLEDGIVKADGPKDMVLEATREGALQGKKETSKKVTQKVTQKVKG